MFCGRFYCSTVNTTLWRPQRLMQSAPALYLIDSLTTGSSNNNIKGVPRNLPGFLNPGLLLTSLHLVINLALPPSSPDAVPHVGRRPDRPSSARPASRSQPVDNFGSESSCQPNPERQEQSFVDRISQNDHGVESFVSSLSCMLSCFVDFCSSWFCRGIYVVFDVGFYCGCPFGNLVRSEDVDKAKGDSEVDDAKEEVHAQSVPAVSLDQGL